MDRATKCENKFDIIPRRDNMQNSAREEEYKARQKKSNKCVK